MSPALPQSSRPRLRSATIQPMTGSWPELPDEGAPGWASAVAAQAADGSRRHARLDLRLLLQLLRLIPANLLWGLGLAVVYLAVLAWWPIAFLLAPLLCGPPVLTMHRIGGRIVRGGDAPLSDGIRAWREVGLGAVVVGAISIVAGAVMLANLLGGIQSSY